MSEYCKRKVLRVPCEKYGIDPWEKEVGKFEVAPTVTTYLDYCLECDNDADCGEWGRSRALTEREKAKYEPIFREVIPNIDMNDVRLVEFCWYDCSEAPDYYNVKPNDSFYDEV